MRDAWLILILPLILACGFGLLWLMHWADRRRIHRTITAQGGRIVRIESGTPSFLRRHTSVQDSTFWRVHDVSSNGEARIAECFASFLRCRIYKDEPKNAPPSAQEK